MTFTTIGYGDVVPDNNMVRLFTCFWSLSGVAFLGFALGVLGSNLIEGAQQDQKKAQVQRQSRVIGLFDHYDATTNKSPTTSDDGGHTTHSYYSTIEEGKRRVMFDVFDDSDDEAANRRGRKSLHGQGGGCQGWSCRITALLRGLVLLFFLLGTLLAISRAEKWDLVTTVYYAIITGTPLL